MSIFWQILAYGLINGALYSLHALGLSLVFGVMSYLNVAHGALIMLSAYLSYWLFQAVGLDPFLSLFIVMPGLFLIGLVLFRLLFIHLIKYQEHEKIRISLLISFGVLLIIPNLVILLWTADERAITTFYSGAVLSGLGLRLPYIGLSTIALALVVIIAMHFFLTRTYVGKAIRAVSQDHEAAGLMGINIGRTYFFSFALGIALAALPGALVALQGMNPEISFELTNKSLIVVILAGVGSINGCLLAGLLLGVVEALGVFWGGGPYREIIGLVLAVVFLLFRPQGLLGKQ